MLDEEMIRKKMDELERQWFELDRCVKVAKQQMSSDGFHDPAQINAAQRQIDSAEEQQKEIIREIEKIEDSLLLD